MNELGAAGPRGRDATPRQRDDFALGVARPGEAASFLVCSMLAEAAGRAGVHVFVTHDSLVTATAARLLVRPLGLDDWPWYLEGALF